MPICIECRYPVHQLYTTYSKADDRALGKGVRLTQCPRCKRFADKYVEHDRVILFIDLVLVKPQVYRHLLFNRLGSEDDQFDLSIVRFGVLLLLFDVYLTWARIEKAYPSPDPTSPNPFSPLTANNSTTPITTPTFLTTQPLLLQYLFFLVFCTLTTLAFHVPIRLLCTLPASFRILQTPYPQPNRISTALLVSSCTKLLPILMVVWDYDLPSSASAVSWAVIVNNIAALEILLDCGYVRAMGLVALGTACRASLGWCVLGAVGLDVGRIMGFMEGRGMDWVGGFFGLL